MNRSNIPNLITVLRIGMVPLVVWFLLRESYLAALITFGIAGFSDALDGFLAKRYGWTSRVGALLDPLADKALLVSSYVSLGWLGVIPLWLVALVLVRDLVIVGGAVAYHFRIEKLEAEPSFLSKLNTATQILLVLALMLNQAILPLPEAWVPFLIYSVAATTVLSGMDYVWNWGWRAWRRGVRSSE